MSERIIKAFLPFHNEVFMHISSNAMTSQHSINLTTTAFSQRHGVQKLFNVAEKPVVVENSEEYRAMFSSPLMHIEGFIEALTNTDKDGRVVINKQGLCPVFFLQSHAHVIKQKLVSRQYCHQAYVFMYASNYNELWMLSENLT